MVLAFIITSLTGDNPLMLYYQVYGQIVMSGSNPDSKEEKPQRFSSTTESGVGEHQRTLRKQHMLRVAERVHSEYQFRREANNLTPEEDIQRLNNDDTLPEFEMGHFRLQTPTISTTRPTDMEDSSVRNFQHVTWMGAALTGFVLLCDSCENRTVAGQVLRLLVRFLQEHVRVLSQPSEIVNRTERIVEVLERVMPDGNLLFMNHRVVRQIEKELETVMKTSS